MPEVRAGGKPSAEALQDLRQGSAEELAFCPVAGPRQLLNSLRRRVCQNFDVLIAVVMPDPLVGRV